MGKRALYGEDIQKIGQIVADGNYENGDGSFDDTLVDAPHIARIVKDKPIAAPMLVVREPRHRARASTVPTLTALLPGTHHPDPTKAENLAQIKQEVKRTHADIDIALDGDGGGKSRDL